MANFWIHVFMVAACIGLGYVIRMVQENWTALDAQIDRLANPDQPRPHVSTYHPSPTQHQASKPNVPAAMSEVKLSADPDKMAQLKAAMKG